VDGYRDLAQQLDRFVADRDWTQFHSPKNLAMALAGEVGELVAELQWLTDTQIDTGLQAGAELRGRVEDEVADVFIYLIRFADQAGIDLFEAARAKTARNEVRYPADAVRGRAVKYNRIGKVAF